MFGPLPGPVPVPGSHSCLCTCIATETGHFIHVGPSKSASSTNSLHEPLTYVSPQRSGESTRHFADYRLMRICRARSYCAPLVLDVLMYSYPHTVILARDN